MDSPFPSAFTAKVHDIYGGEAAAFLAAMGPKTRIGFRVNPLRAEPEATLASLASLHPEPVPWCPHGYTIAAQDRDALTHHATAEDGRIYIQNPSTWLPVLALGVAPGMRVLDLAAAPGGKALHMAALLQGEGELSAIEPVRGRFFRLKANVERAAAPNVRLFNKDGRGVGKAVPEHFDRVMLDAPCSSEARFRHDDPASWAHWKPGKVKEARHKQTGLIRAAWDALKPGGRMIYATCAVSPEEDEGVLKRLLRYAPDAEVLPVQVPDGVPSRPGLISWQGRALPEACVHAVRVLPDPTLLDPFFFALIGKPHTAA